MREAMAKCVFQVLAFRRGSMCAWSNLETGISPEGAVSLVLSMYIGLYIIITQTLTWHPFSHIPVARENQPWCLRPVDSLQVIDKKGVLFGGVSVVVLCAHHHNVNGAKVKAIPAMNNSYLGECKPIEAWERKQFLIIYTLIFPRSDV